LEVMGEAAKRLSGDCRYKAPCIPWRAMAGMRDLLIHAYDRVDLEEAGEAYLQPKEIRQQIHDMIDKA